MVDTVVILARWTLAPDIVTALNERGFHQLGQWYFTAAKRPDWKTGSTYVEISGNHRSSGIHIRGKEGVIEWIQVSLPRLLHGYNGRLILTPFQLDDSIDLLFTHLREIATAVEELIEFVRVHLVLNLPCDPKRMVLAHQRARHPWVRQEDHQYGEEGIRFAGKERVLQMYWKQKERADKQGFKLPPLSKSIRVEVQLNTKDAVRGVLNRRPGKIGEKPEREKGENEKHRDKEDWAERSVGHLDFFQCYRMFRHALCLFDREPVSSIPGEKCTLHSLIAECEAQGFKTSFDIGAWDWFSLSGQQPATLNRVRRLVTQRKRELMHFRWADMLPPLRLPEPAVDIYPDGREVELRGFW